MLVVNLAISDIVMILTNGVPLAYNVFVANYWIFGKYQAVYLYIIWLYVYIFIKFLVFIQGDKNKFVSKQCYL